MLIHESSRDISVSEQAADELQNTLFSFRLPKHKIGHTQNLSQLFWTELLQPPAFIHCKPGRVLLGTSTLVRFCQARFDCSPWGKSASLEPAQKAIQSKDRAMKDTEDSEIPKHSANDTRSGRLNLGPPACFALPPILWSRKLTKMASTAKVPDLWETKEGMTMKAPERERFVKQVNSRIV